ncbi:Fanconi anemia group E protein isoform X3 [Ambystoma mexicanum]|uniref:Fanconi anemia group E protein isoform X3 n=2 Tax=Ambystoma mexicanum TaxID=8296 RepID=UPI0037E6FC57
MNGPAGGLAAPWHSHSCAGTMEERTHLWLEPFDKPSRLLLHALMSGPSGSLTASRTLQRIQSRQGPEQQPFSWLRLVDTLCRDEPSLEGPEKRLTLKPLLLLLPLLCQRNFLRLLHLAHPPAPSACLHKVIKALDLGANLDPWISSLKALLLRDLEGKSTSPPHNPLTDQCRQRLRDLCRGITSEGEGRPESESRLGWYRDSWHKDQCQATDKALGPESQYSRKRKNPDTDTESPALCLEEGQLSKKSRLAVEEMDIDLYGESKLEAFTDSDATMEEDKSATVKSALHIGQHRTGSEESPASQNQTVNLHQPAQEPDHARELPESIKSKVLKLKELLQTEPELDHMCLLLHVPELSEQALLQFCTKLQPLCPDLSYSNAAILSKHLFLNRVLLLTEPASRLLLTALTLFCSKYAQATCGALIGPLLQTPDQGPVLVDLLCRIIEECLEPDHLILVVSEVLEVPWSEDILTVLHSMLARGVELPPVQFDLLIRKLNHWAPEFIKSMKFAKLMLNVFTKYQSYVLPSHHKSLSSTLALNETFLKKSLQAALKRLSAP